MNASSGLPTVRAGVPIACRAINEDDLPAITSLLIEGFPQRTYDYWRRGFARLAAREVIDGYPRYGYLLAIDGVIVGCILLIVSQEAGVGASALRGNVSSWYVRPAYRFLASMLVSRLFRHTELTFVNISPAPHTMPILQAQGYRKFSSGQIVLFPAVRRAKEACVESWRDGASCDLAEDERALLQRHAGYGCIAVVGRDAQGCEPFVFARTRPVRGVIPAAQLVWCRDVASLARFAEALSGHLFRRGLLAIVIDANGPIDGVPGIYRRDRGAKFYRGPNPPRLGDLADTELAIFGA